MRVLDPIVLGAGGGLLASLVAGSALVRTIESLPRQWRRSAQWLIVAGAAGVAIVADAISSGPGAQGMVVFLLAALPGIVAYLAARTILASALVSLAPVYFVVGELTRGRPTYMPFIALDHAVPLQPAWMLVYGSLSAFVMFLPLLVVRDRELGRRAMQAYLSVMIVGYAGFVLYPTTAPRPTYVGGGGFFAWSLRLAYSIDPPHGCFPSLHVAYSFVSALTCYRVHRGVGVAAAVWAALIGVSTLYTKQHYVVDVVAGAAVAFVAYAVFLRRYPRDRVSDADRRAAPLRAAGVVAIFGVIVACVWTLYAAGVAAV
jgi:membrane-associated phospholipid phosphatase